MSLAITQRSQAFRGMLAAVEQTHATVLADFDKALQLQVELVASLKELAFVVETVAHLQGKEGALLPMADKARELIDRAGG